MLNFKLIARILSLILLIVTASFIICIGIAWMYSENIYPFISSAFISLAIGLLLRNLSHDVDKNVDVQKKEAYLVVTASWILLGLVGTLPYLFSGAIPTFIDALFESESGFSTTGASILTDVESLPKSILFWRSLTHWIGGIGIIVLVIIVLPSLKIGGYHLFTMESSFQDKIKPKIRQVGSRLLFIYLTLTALEVALLLLGNMNLFESVCHAFGTIATGGFSPKNSSIGGYSPYIQYVVMIFMMLSGTNFIIHYYLVKREISKITGNEEFRFYLTVLVVTGGVIATLLFFDTNKPLEASIRESFFQVISIVTTTGYATADYLLWPRAAWLIIFFAMFLGGSAGSTAGGIKMVRQLILLKSLKTNFRLLLHPNAIIPVRLNKKALPYNASSSTITFIIFYLMLFGISTFGLNIMGLDGQTASSSVATCMAGIGPGIGTVGPSSTFAHLPDLGKIELTFLMILGRLEMFTVLVLFTRNFWKS